MVGTDLVQKTDLTRKITYGGKTVAYPVYRVRLDALYYNDQNDRIATVDQPLRVGKRQGFA